MKHPKDFMKAMWTENPVLVAGMGLCPILAVSVTVSAAAWLAFATVIVTLGSNAVASSGVVLLGSSRTFCQTLLASPGSVCCARKPKLTRNLNHLSVESTKAAWLPPSWLE